MPISSRRPDVHSAGSIRSRLLALTAGMLVLVVGASSAVVRAADPAAIPPHDGLRPTIQYEEAMAHAADKITFAVGERVTVPFRPRKTDRWAVGGVLPQELPAGRLTGKELRNGTGASRLKSGPAAQPAVEPVAVEAIDAPYLDPASSNSFELAAAVDPGGLKREVFGFLPYWELTDTSTRLDWEKLSTIAYFGVGAAANGDLQRTNSDGSPTVGWSGWTSAKLTGVINAAHTSGARVVLTVQSFAWTSTGVTRQKALLGSATARANLARQIAAAVRDRGADGVNLDFEPIAATYADEFTSLVRTVRAELNKVWKGYQLTFDTTGWIGNYPIEAATAAGGADAVVIMGYDYRTGTSNPVGSVAPLGGPGYDIADTVASYVNRVSASKLILGVPYYGRAWSTDSALLHAKNVSGTKYGASTTVLYETARQFAVDYGRKWDPVEGVAWTAYHRQNCTATYGCVTPWRQLYYDDAQALGLKYDLVNRYNLRGAGIWALGYDGTRPELYEVLKAKFITDTVPPTITSSTLSGAFISANGDGRMETATVWVAVTGHIKFGWLVQPFFDGIAGTPIRSGSVTGKVVAFTWDGKDDRGAIAPDGPYRITVWTADASNNRSSVAKVVTVDRRAARVVVGASPSFISPNGDGHSDRMTLTMHADEAVSGVARLIDRSGAIVRSWPISAMTARGWIWDGRDRLGRIVRDDRYTFQVVGFDRAGNQTVSQRPVSVDRTIRSVIWSRSSFIPRAGQKARVTFILARPATVTVAIYQGSTRIATVWSARALAGGSYGWTWTGKTASGAFVRPGVYTALIDATSWVGRSTFTRSITVKAP